MILFDLIKESVKQIDRFYGKTLLRSTLSVSGRIFHYEYPSVSYRYYSSNSGMVIIYLDDKIVDVFLPNWDPITIEFDDILSNDLEYLVLIYGKILLEEI